MLGALDRNSDTSITGRDTRCYMEIILHLKSMLPFQGFWSHLSPLTFVNGGTMQTWYLSWCLGASRWVSTEALRCPYALCCFLFSLWCYVSLTACCGNAAQALCHGKVLQVAVCVYLQLNRNYIISFFVVIRYFFSVVMKLVAHKRTRDRCCWYNIGGDVHECYIFECEVMMVF